MTNKLDKENGHEKFDKLSVTKSKSTRSDARRENFVVENAQPTIVGFLEAEVN